ncbi:MAG: ATP-binding protein [Clostridium sp.]|nr:ATP-binding protein [Clostridium sp.]MCM1398415.1 ATP-binding protein [Clostridium sp.]MCM1458920.1 ATP-binding protein [Bacteroides sp.]
MKKYKNRILLICTCGFAIIFIVALLSWFYNQLNVKSYNITIENTIELAEHDRISIEAVNDTNWEMAESIHYRMLRYGYKSLDEMQAQLNVEQNSSTFEKIYYITQDGMAYSGDYTITKEEKFQQAFLDNDGRFVMRLDNTDGIMNEMKKEYLVYGISIKSFELNGIVFTGMVCQMSLDTIHNTMMIESYDGQGYSSVIDMEGNYIVRVNRSYDVLFRENFFEGLSHGYIDGKAVNVDAVMQKMRDKERFTQTYIDDDKNEKIVTFCPVEDTDWYFIIVISDSIVKSQSNSLMRMSAIIIAIILIVIGLIATLLFVTANKSVKATAQVEARSDFLSNMSHEIRTPLNGLIGLNYLMQENISNEEKLQDYLKKSADTAQYLLSLVNDILDMSKLQAGKVNLFYEPVNLIDVIDNVASMQRFNIEERGIRFIVETEAEYPVIECDETRLKQVLMNLLSNAAKFTPSGGHILLKLWQDKAQNDKVCTYFKVEDSGCGMSKEFCNHIFEAFTQEKGANTKSQKGTGLGMAISHLLMQSMQGDLSVESELGKGSCFTAKFTAKVMDDVDDKTVHTENIKETEIGNLHILIAEDNELNAEILTGILEGVNAKAEIAQNGQEAVDKFSASGVGEYDVILMDVQMPVMNGYEAAQAIRKLNRDDAKSVIIFACTANTFREDVDRAIESGMNDFLGKPIDVNELMRKLRGI